MVATVGDGNTMGDADACTGGVGSGVGAGVNGVIKFGRNDPSESGARLDTTAGAMGFGTAAGASSVAPGSGAATMLGTDAGFACGTDVVKGRIGGIVAWLVSPVETGAFGVLRVSAGIGGVGTGDAGMEIAAGAGCTTDGAIGFTI